MTLQLSVKCRLFSLLGQKCQNGIVDELLFILREKTLKRKMRKTEPSVRPGEEDRWRENHSGLDHTHVLRHCMKHSAVGYVGIKSEHGVSKISI